MFWKKKTGNEDYEPVSGEQASTGANIDESNSLQLASLQSQQWTNPREISEPPTPSQTQTRKSRDICRNWRWDDY